MPLAAVLIAAAIDYFSKKYHHRQLLLIMLLSLYPIIFLFEEIAYNNTQNLVKINYVLTNTSRSDYVFDGDI